MPGLLRGVARTAVIAGTATAVCNRVSRRQASAGRSRSRAVRRARAQYAAPPRAGRRRRRRPTRSSSSRSSRSSSDRASSPTRSSRRRRPRSSDADAGRRGRRRRSEAYTRLGAVFDDDRHRRSTTTRWRRCVMLALEPHPQGFLVGARSRLRHTSLTRGRADRLAATASPASTCRASRPGPRSTRRRGDTCRVGSPDLAVEGRRRRGGLDTWRPQLLSLASAVRPDGGLGSAQAEAGAGRGRLVFDLPHRRHADLHRRPPRPRRLELDRELDSAQQRRDDPQRPHVRQRDQAERPCR